MDDSKLLDLILEERGAEIVSYYSSSEARDLRGQILPLRWKINSFTQESFFNGIESVLTAWIALGRSRREMWELEYNIIMFREGRTPATDWLENNIFSGEFDAWMAHILIQSCLESGNIQRGRDILNRLVFRTSSNSLKWQFPLIEMYDARFEKAICLIGLEKPHHENYHFRLQIYLSKITGRYEDALNLLAQSPPLATSELSYLTYQNRSYRLIKDLAAKNNYKDKIKTPLLVLTTDKNGTRLKRLTVNLRLFNAYYEIIEGFNGKCLPDNWLRRLSFDSRDVTAIDFRDFAKRVGCFVAHYKAWVHIVEKKLRTAVILEDDALLHIDPQDLLQPDHLEKFEFIFLNERMEMRLNQDVDHIQTTSVVDYNTKRVKTGIIGADIYWLTENMANKLIRLANETGPSFHLDQWLISVAANKFPDDFALSGPSLGAEYDLFR